MRCVALHELRKVLSVEDAPKSSVARAQATWVAASASTNELVSLLTESLRETSEMLGSLDGRLKEAQTALRQRVEWIRVETTNDR